MLCNLADLVIGKRNSFGSGHENPTKPGMRLPDRSVGPQCGGQIHGIQQSESCVPVGKTALDTKLCWPISLTVEKLDHKATPQRALNHRRAKTLQRVQPTGVSRWIAGPLGKGRTPPEHSSRGAEPASEWICLICINLPDAYIWDKSHGTPESRFPHT